MHVDAGSGPELDGGLSDRASDCLLGSCYVLQYEVRSDKTENGVKAQAKEYALGSKSQKLSGLCGRSVPSPLELLHSLPAKHCFPPEPQPYLLP